MLSSISRRRLLAGGSAAGALVALPVLARAQSSPAERRFAPDPQAGWRRYELTTRVELAEPAGASRIWVPVPALAGAGDWQRSLGDSFSGNGAARLAGDGVEGARFVQAEFAEGVRPVLEVTSRVATRDRRTDLSAPPAAAAPAEDAATLRHHTRATRLLPTDGIVRTTALKATQGARSDEQKVRAIYDWVIANSWREPTVRGCGEGDIRAMLETGNLGGKCADINALFVGLCRAVGVPARDVYGLRLAPSASGYKELGANAARLQGAQHCRAEVHLAGRGWVAMDPADVAKVMRQESPEWIKSVRHPLVTPVHAGLYGGWEGNWVGFNTAHDLRLPGARDGVLNFLMYPVAETAEGRVDSYAPDAFRYTITAREITA